MDKTGSIEVGKTPCAFCGKASERISMLGNPICSECSGTLKKSAMSNDTVRTNADLHDQGAEDVGSQ